MFYKGLSVNVYNRILTVLDYADEPTKTFYGSHNTIFIFLKDLSKFGQVLVLSQENKFTICDCRSVSVKDLSSAGVPETFLPEYGSVVALRIAGTGTFDAWNRTMESYGLADIVLSTTTPIELSFSPSVPKTRNLSLCLLKPHTFKDASAGKIVRRIQEHFLFDVLSVSMLHLSPEEIDEFVAVYKGVMSSQEYCNLTKELASGPVMALALGKKDSKNVVDDFRLCCGPYIVEIAKKVQPQSLRATFGKSTRQNAVHCTDLSNEGLLEDSFRN
eukprot:g2118.t1